MKNPLKKWNFETEFIPETFFLKFAVSQSQCKNSNLARSLHLSTNWLFQVFERLSEAFKR